MSDVCIDKKQSVTTIRKVAIFLLQNKDKIKIEIDRWSRFNESVQIGRKNCNVNNNDNERKALSECVSTREEEGQRTVGVKLSQGPTAQQFSICQSPDYATANRGLRITIDGNTLIFNGNGVVDTGTDQTITSIKTFEKVVQINPIGNNFNEGVRISRSANSDYCGLNISLSAESGDTARGLQISAEGNTLTFNGRTL
ncbi:MAG: hypothetical protein EZS28_022442 [Streblomastix strix]|uniref:Uncharacterized protein n=1 Tax=Streblomastix strix TaxID=222440 RepID=A0A5J4VID7_9EUKA|nr:MAG: hypothetical protein EZS28_022442 [Streblomastix strix]